MRKGLKRGSVLLIATGFLALAYHIGNQCGPSIPLEPPAYDPADLAPPTPIVDELAVTAPRAGCRECDDPAPINSPQPVSSISRKIRIVSVDAAPLEPRPNEIIIPAVAVGKEPAKIEDSQDPPLTHEENPEPVSRRRSVEEDEVAWHVVETPGNKPSPGSSTGATLFREPGAMGHTDDGDHHEAMNSPIAPSRVAAEPASPQPTTAQSRGSITVPASAPLPEKATRLEEKKPAMDSSPATKSQKIEPSKVPSTMSPAQAIPAPKIDPPTVKQESKVKATSPPSAHSSPISATAAQSSAVSKPPVLAQSSVGAKSSDIGIPLKGDVHRSRPRKARIVSLSPLPSKVATEAGPLKAKIRELESKSATWPPPLVSLPPANAKFSSMKPARELTQSKPKVKELPPLSFKPRTDSIPIISAPKEATASLRSASASAIVPVVHKVQGPLEKIRVVSPEKSTAPSLGEVFLPPAELPASVTAAASELATQKLISRSLNSSTGVAARLANASHGLAGPDGSALILAGGHSGAESSADDEGARSATGTVHFAATKEEIAAGAHLDYVTSGVVILGDPLPAMASSEVTPSAQQELLKNAIRAACGAQVSDLDVSLERNHALRIRLKAPHDTEPNLRQTILALPALADYKVHLNIQVSP